MIMACKYKSRVWDNGWCNVACRYCTLTQESDCEHNKQTNADRIRAASDEELAQKLLQFNTLEESVPFCRNLAECDELLDTEDGIPEEKCKQCLLNWLRQPAEVE
jgi:hypothetical protein